MHLDESVRTSYPHRRLISSKPTPATRGDSLPSACSGRATARRTRRGYRTSRRNRSRPISSYGLQVIWLGRLQLWSLCVLCALYSYNRPRGLPFTCRITSSLITRNVLVIFGDGRSRRKSINLAIGLRVDIIVIFSMIIINSRRICLIYPAIFIARTAGVHATAGIKWFTSSTPLRSHPIRSVGPIMTRHRFEHFSCNASPCYRWLRFALSIIETNRMQIRWWWWGDSDCQ